MIKPSPVTAVPAAPVPAMPAPMTMAPTPVAAVPAPVMPVPVSPADLLGLEMLDLSLGRDRGMNILICVRLLLISAKRKRRQRCCLGARGQRGGSGGKSNGELQKMTAFHDISLFVAMASDAGESLNALR